MIAPRRDAGDTELSGTQLVGVLLVIALLALALPAGGAVWINRSRVARADRDLRRVAAALCRGAAPAAAVTPSPTTSARVVLVGAGNLPRTNAASTWLTTDAHSLAPASAEMSPDPWGNGYVAVLPHEAPPAMRGWVLTAGPNGIVDTTFDPIDGHPIAGGDDLTVPICEARE